MSGFTLTKFIPADSTMWDNPEFPISALHPGQQSKTIEVMRAPKTIVCKGLFTSMHVHLAVVFVCPTNCVVHADLHRTGMQTNFISTVCCCIKSITDSTV